MQSRGGKGVKAGSFNEKTGKLVGLKLIGADENIMIITANGTIIRVASSDISSIGRATQGVRVMRTEDGATVSKIAITPESDEETEGENDADSSEIVSGDTQE